MASHVEGNTVVIESEGHFKTHHYSSSKFFYPPGSIKL